MCPFVNLGTNLQGAWVRRAINLRHYETGWCDEEVARRVIVELDGMACAY